VTGYASQTRSGRIDVFVTADSREQIMNLVHDVLSPASPEIEHAIAKAIAERSDNNWDLNVETIRRIDGAEEQPPLWAHGNAARAPEQPSREE